ncbi:MAG: short-chain dehydrogenase [Actinomycetia bacterium]|nr:short-chain dehydrogenase [Actinomycetes bacterium]
MPIALVTGATAGIGAAFVRLLSSEGYDLVLVARDEARLKSSAAGLPGEAEIISADLSTTGGCQLVEQRLADDGRPVDLLVNNAGIGLAHSFVNNSIDDEERLLAINVRAVMRLTHAALPGMIARGRGGVINVSSVAGFAPMLPGHTYSASKAWVTNFSESLYTSMRPRGVRVMALAPGFVRTEFHDSAGIDMDKLSDWQWLDADDVVRTALADLRRWRPVSTPSVAYKVLGGLARHVPRPLFRAVTGRASKRIGRNPN